MMLQPERRNCTAATAGDTARAGCYRGTLEFSAAQGQQERLRAGSGQSCEAGLPERCSQRLQRDIHTRQAGELLTVCMHYPTRCEQYAVEHCFLTL